MCLHCCCLLLAFFFGTKVERTHCDPKHWAVAFVSLYKTENYSCHLNIPIMFKCFQNLSTRHRPKTSSSYAHYEWTDTRMPKLTIDLALIVYLLNFQRNEHTAITVALFFYLHWSWASWYVSYWHTFLTATVTISRITYISCHRHALGKKIWFM